MRAPRLPSRWGRKLAYAAGAAFVVGGVALALGPAAPWIVDNMGDGQRVWRLGRLQLDGVSGAWLGVLRAERLSIADEDGVWLTAEDVTLDWSPFALVAGDVRLEDVRAARVAVLRQPDLLEPRPPSGVDFDIALESLAIERIDVAEAVYGGAAQFTAELALNLHGDDLRLLDLDLRRLDSDADRAHVLYRPDENYALDIDIASAPGGLLARALGVGERGLSARAEGQGDAQTGSGDFSARIGAERVAAGTATWTPSAWRFEANGTLALIPGAQNLARRIGSNVSVIASGERVGRFDVHAETPFLAIDLTGELDEERELVGSAHLEATTQRLSDIARESPLELGPARLVGELRRARGTTAVRGRFHAERIEALGQSVALSGPLEASLNEDRFALEADLRAPEQAPALFADARLRAELHYDREQRRFALERATLDSAALAIDARGWARRGAQGEFSGDWRVRRLEAVRDGMRGEADGAWRAFGAEHEGERVWTVTVAGDGSGIESESELIAQLLGASPELDAMLRIEDGGLTVSHARIDGARLRAGARGRIVSGIADLALEASARGPLDIGGATLQGAIDATGQLTGRLARPTLTAEAAMSSFSAAGAVIAQPRLQFTLAPTERGYAGRAQLRGMYSGQTLIASSDVAIVGETIRLDDLEAQLGALTAQGSAQIAAAGVSADLEIEGRLDGLFNGGRGAIVGDLTLRPSTLALNAHIADARIGDLRVRAATLSARGPFDAVAATFDMRGRLRQAPLAFTGAGTVNLEANTARFDGRGALAGFDIFTRAPIVISWGGGRMTASLNLAMGDGVVRANWQERGRALSGSAQVEGAPLAPIAAIWGERATGRIDGRLEIASRGGGLAGEADLVFDDARFAGRQRGTLDLRVLASLEPRRLRANVDARSSDGLVARFAADAPVVTDVDPILIALAPERRGEATWTVAGPAQSLWAAARLQDQTLEGRIDGQGSLRFGAGYLSGSGYLEIVDGRFEDKLTGVTLVDLDARIAIGDEGVRIESFSASGPRGGRLTATGGSANPREGEIAVSIRDMYIADRPEIEAIGSGELTLAWRGLESRLSGALNIAEANIDVAVSPTAGIPTLDVIEINRPGYDDELEEDEPERPPERGRVALDVAVTAPGRVFTRGRGIDAEWSLDLRLAGTADNPLVYGRARAIRGAIALSGQPFSIEDALIVFTGDPMEARIDLTATRDTADLTAYLRLTGTARQPEISFTSDPPLPEDEILPQVLFGRSVEDLSALEAAQLASSLAALSGRASFDLVDAARAAAGLDRFAVRQDENGGFLVAGGVYLTRDVYVEVARTGLGQAQTQVEWTIRPRLVLITSFLGNGDQRVSLRWRRESD